MTAYWFKPEDRVYRDWFRPLEELAARVAQQPRLPQVNPNHFLYAARIDRDGLSRLHVYRHIATRKFINVDESGTLWKYTGSDKVGVARYVQLVNVADALAGADLLRGNLIVGHLRSRAEVGAAPAGPPAPDSDDGPQLAAPEPEPVIEPAGEPAIDPAWVRDNDVAADEAVVSVLSDVVLPDVEVDLLDAAYEGADESDPARDREPEPVSV